MPKKKCVEENYPCDDCVSGLIEKTKGHWGSCKWYRTNIFIHFQSSPPSIANWSLFNMNWLNNFDSAQNLSLAEEYKSYKMMDGEQVLDVMSSDDVNQSLEESWVVSEAFSISKWRQWSKKLTNYHFFFVRKGILVILMSWKKRDLWPSRIVSYSVWRRCVAVGDHVGRFETTVTCDFRMAHMGFTRSTIQHPEVFCGGWTTAGEIWLSLSWNMPVPRRNMVKTWLVRFVRPVRLLYET